jgi:predicted nucleic acid-binding protein
MGILKKIFEKRFRVFSIVEVLPSLIHTSGEIARDYKIKGCDAFQVASALIDEADLIVSTDQDLNEAAKANDLRVWNPMREPIPHI